jgi:hypothetical protein
MGGTCSAHGEKRSGYTVLVGKPEAKRQFGKLGCRWKDTIKIYIKAVGYWDVKWFYWDYWPALVITILNLQALETMNS